MDVVCERCKTEYEFDDALVSERGTTVKCTNCGFQFKIFRSAADPEAARVWNLRRPDGTVIPFDSLAVLQKWIMEGRVSKMDELCRPGEPWKALGAIAELDSFFATAGPGGASLRPNKPPGTRDGSVRTPLGTPPPPGAPSSRPVPPKPPGPGNTLRPMAGPGAVPATPPPVPVTPPVPVLPPSLGNTGPRQALGPGKFPAELGSQPSALPRPPSLPERSAPAELPMLDPLPPPPRVPNLLDPVLVSAPPVGAIPDDAPTINTSREALDEPSLRPPKGSGAPVGLLLGAGFGLLVAVGGVVAWKQGLFEVSRPGRVEVQGHHAQVTAMLQRAQLLERRGDRRGFEDAREELTRTLTLEPSNLLAQVLRAEVMAAWSEALRQKASDLDQRAASPGADAAALRAEAQLLRQESRDRAERARTDLPSDEARLGQVPPVERAAIQVALASAHRSLGDTAAARRALDAARQGGASGPALELCQALLELEASEVPQATARLQQVVAQAPDQVRAHTALARLHAARGDADSARRELDAVLQRFPGHEDALSLQDALARGVAPMEARAGGPAPVADAAVAGRTPVGNPPTTPDNPRDPREPREPREPRGQGYDALVEEGERLQTDGRTAQARLVFQQALTQRAGGAEALTGLGYCELDAHNVSGAISRFRQALATNSRYSEALIGLAEAYSHRGDYRNALETYQQYLQVNPNGSRAGMAQRQIESLRDRLQEQENRRQNQANPNPGTTEPAPESPPGGAAPGATAPKAG